jgi:hypothetical protein
MPASTPHNQSRINLRLERCGYFLKTTPISETEAATVATS